MKGINPGRLNKKVNILRYIETEDELANIVSTLSVHKKVWAEIRPLRGSEQLEHYKTTSKLVYKITIRNTDVTEKDVIEYQGGQFLINYIVNPLEANYYLELMCTENKDHEERRE
jgi:putative phage head-tail adaptor